VYGSIFVVLVLLVVAVWGFGGLKRRTDSLRTVPVGTLFTTGPYEFRFTEATAQHKKNYDDTFYWEVVMVGEGVEGTKSGLLIAQEAIPDPLLSDQAIRCLRHLAERSVHA
jgi:hypothetical protein